MSPSPQNPRIGRIRVHQAGRSGGQGEKEKGRGSVEAGSKPEGKGTTTASQSRPIEGCDCKASTCSRKERQRRHQQSCRDEGKAKQQSDDGDSSQHSSVGRTGQLVVNPESSAESCDEAAEGSATDGKSQEGSASGAVAIDRQIGKPKRKPGIGNGDARSPSECGQHATSSGTQADSKSDEVEGNPDIHCHTFGGLLCATYFGCFGSFCAELFACSTRVAQCARCTVPKIFRYHSIRNAKLNRCILIRTHGNSHSDTTLFPFWLKSSRGRCLAALSLGLLSPASP